MKSKTAIGNIPCQNLMKWYGNGIPLKFLPFSMALMTFAATFSGFRIGNIFDCTPSNIPVLMKYGATDKTLTLLLASFSSILMDSVQPITAHLLAQ